MTKTADLNLLLQQMLPGCRQVEMEQHLLQNSNLPGPRGNLELALAFATCYASPDHPPLNWLEQWLQTADQPEFLPAEREYLPVCALHALGARYPQADQGERQQIASHLRRLANAPNWRVRESVAIGLQLMAEWDFPTTATLLQGWLDDQPTLLQARAIAAALAHPPVLHQEQTAAALRLMQSVVDVLRDCGERKTDQFRVLRQGLEYALSVVVAADPGPGFAWLRELAAADDPDLRRIVRKNLEKQRLQRFPEAAAAVSRILTEQI